MIRSLLISSVHTVAWLSELLNVHGALCIRFINSWRHNNTLCMLCRVVCTVRINFLMRLWDESPCGWNLLMTAATFWKKGMHKELTVFCLYWQPGIIGQPEIKKRPTCHSPQMARHAWYADVCSTTHRVHQVARHPWYADACSTTHSVYQMTRHPWYADACSTTHRVHQVARHPWYADACSTTHRVHQMARHAWYADVCSTTHRVHQVARHP